ncbi:MAG: hypothetical protein J6L77_05530 [Coprococcus sp.]|nr:hypothetical protein [Coprococcus sp.]
MKKISVLITALVMLFAVSITVYANSSPTADFSTDSSDILVADADASIPDIKKLLGGSLPKDVLGDETLDGYSTLGIFSVTAVGEYDFSESVTTDIRTAGLTSDMTVKVKILDKTNQWSNVSHTISNGVVSAVLKKEGQVAVFVLDSVDIEDTEEDTNEPTTQGQTEENPQDGKKPGGSPKTGDAILWFGTAAFLAMAGIVISLKKLK